MNSESKRIYLEIPDDEMLDKAINGLMVLMALYSYASMRKLERANGNQIIDEGIEDEIASFTGFTCPVLGAVKGKMLPASFAAEMWRDAHLLARDWISAKVEPDISSTALDSLKYLMREVEQGGSADGATA